MATLSTGGTTSATLALDAFAGVSVACDASVQGTLTFVSAAPNLRSNFTAKIQNKTYGPWGVPGTLTLSVTAGSATYTVVNVGAGSVSGLSFDQTTAAATANTTAIQAALTAGGLVQITAPGVYYINSTLTIPSDTRIELGAGVIIRQLNSSEGNLLVNSNWKSPKITMTNGVNDAATTPAFQGIRLCTADCGANAHGFSVGDYVLQRGDTTRRYNGVFKVVSVVDAFKYTFYASKKTAIGASAGTLTTEKANANIEVTGGTWDFNGLNNQSSYNMPAMMMVFSKVLNLNIHDVSLLNATKYNAYIINSQNTIVKNVYSQSSSDCIHLHGFTYNAWVENITGESGDDFVAWTATNAGFTQYDFLNTDGSDSMSTGGDMLGLTARNLWPIRCGEDVLALYPIGATNNLEGVVVDTIETNQDSANCLFVCATGGTGVAGVVKDIVLRNVRGIGRSNTILFGRSTDTNGLTFDKIDLSGIYPNGTFNFAAGMILINKATIAKMIVEPRTKITYDVTSAVYFIQPDATSTINDLTVVDYECATTGAGSFHSVLAPATGCTLTTVKFIRPRLFGTSQLMTGSPSGTPVIQVSDWYVDTSRLAWLNFNCRLEVRNGRVRAGGGTQPITVYGTGITADVVAFGNDWGNTNNWLQVGTAAGDTPTCNLYFGNHASDAGIGTGITWTATAPTVRLRASDGSLTVDAAKFTSINSGCVYYNSNAAFGAGVGLYGQGAAAGTRIAA